MDVIKWGIIGSSDVAEVKNSPAFQKVKELLDANCIGKFYL